MCITEHVVSESRVSTLRRAHARLDAAGNGGMTVASTAFVRGREIKKAYNDEFCESFSKINSGTYSDYTHCHTVARLTFVCLSLLSFLSTVLPSGTLRKTAHSPIPA